MEKIKIMIVEDDESLAKMIKDHLQRWKYAIALCQDFTKIMEVFAVFDPHLVLLDINLPFFDGYHWCTKIRSISNVPIIFISSYAGDKDKIRGIVQGGDDYLTKPFSLELLSAKVEAILRRTYKYGENKQIYLNDKLAYDVPKNALIYDGQRIELTKSENIIIELLVRKYPAVVSRDQLMDALWNTNEFICNNTLSVLISRLRSKLFEVCQEDIIKTKKGQGYHL